MDSIKITVNGNLLDKSTHWIKEIRFLEVGDKLNIKYIERDRVVAEKTVRIEIKRSEFVYRILKTKIALSDSFGDTLKRVKDCDATVRYFFSQLERGYSMDRVRHRIDNK